MSVVKLANHPETCVRVTEPHTPKQTKLPTDTMRIFRRRVVRTTSLLTAATLSGAVIAASGAARRKVDVCIYGRTSGGVMAASTLARLGRSGLLIEPTRHVGGMTSGGLGWIDFGRESAIGGATKKYFDDARRYAASVGV